MFVTAILRVRPTSSSYRDFAIIIVLFCCSTGTFAFIIFFPTFISELGHDGGGVCDIWRDAERTTAKGASIFHEHLAIPMQMHWIDR